MSLKKTCWLAASTEPCRAMIGTCDNVDLDPFIRFGFFLGAAFQIQDDLLNLVADESYGKECNGDISEGKRTLMLIRLFQESKLADRQRLVDIFGLSRESARTKT